ncbi:MAG: glycerophosphodiester phosphodiesterase family protein [Candidatus Hydrogenedentes bacterium]|nr:glycerophosphodiester phosphodiesterase family protein [Candidatus Hydrogenedentota bacterium]
MISIRLFHYGLALFLLAGGGAAAEFFEPLQPPRAFQVMVHRGAMLQAPENTAPALERCIEEGFEWAEVDIRLTSDGKHILFHDEQVDGKSNGTGDVKKMTLAELKALDAGSWFSARFAGERLLTLGEGLSLCRGRLNLYLDCKDVDPILLADEVLAAGMEKQVVVFDAPEKLAQIRERSQGRVPIMPKWHPEYGTEGWVEQWRPDAVEVNADEVTKAICEAFHKRGIKVQAKVLDEADQPEVWQRMRDAGVDWFQTDRAEEVIMHLSWSTLPNRPVQISHHRAANYYAPENTIVAMEKSLRLAADYVEFDVRTSSDGRFFILHDPNLGRTTNGEGKVAETDAATLAGLEASWDFGKPFAGLKIPTLEETFELLGGKTGLYVDAYDITPEALADGLKKHNLLDSAVVYQSPEYLIKLKTVNPEIRALCPLSDANQIVALHQSVRPYGFDVSWKILSEDLIRRCHDLGIKVFSDSVDDYETAADYQQAVKWGIDVIQTDYPVRVADALTRLSAESR